MGKRITLVLEHPRMDYVYKRNGNDALDFWASQEGKNYLNYFKGAGIDKKDIDVTYFYPLIPKPLKQRNGRVFSYEKLLANQTSPYMEQLEETIISNDPEIIITTGAMGNKYFTGKGAMKDVRGRPNYYTINGKEYTIFPMYGPTYMSINNNASNMFRADLGTLNKFLDKGQQAFEPEIGNYEYVNTLERVKEIYSYLLTNKPVVAWDLETNTLEPNLKGSKVLVISMSWEVGQGVTIPVSHKESPFTREEQATIMACHKLLMADKGIIKVAHNGRFDIHFLMSTWDFKEFNNTQDTIVAYWLTVSQEVDDSFKLSDLSFYYTNMGDYDRPLEEFKVKYVKDYNDAEAERVKKEKAEQKETIKAYAKENKITQAEAKTRLGLVTPEKKKLTNEIDGSNFNYEWIPMDMLAEYASGDTDVTLQIYIALMKQVNEDQRWVYLMTDFYPRLIVSLATMQHNGLAVDRNYLKQSLNKYEEDKEYYINIIQENPSVQEVVNEWQELYEMGLEEYTKPVKERDKDIADLKNKYKKKLDEGFKPSSAKDKQWLLYKVIGIRPPLEKEYLTTSAQSKNFDKEPPTWEDFKTNKETIEWVADNHPEHKEVCESLLGYIKANTISNTFIKSFLDRINRETSDGLIHGTFNPVGTACVTGDTLVITDKGILPIETISDNREAGTFSDVELNVPTANGIEKVGGFYYSGVKDGIKITLCDGTEITTTPNHPLMVSNFMKGSKHKNRRNRIFKEQHRHDNSWVNAEDIVPNESYVLKKLNTQVYGDKVDISYTAPDKVFTNTKTNVTLPNKLTTELSEWLGMYMADGNVNKSNGSYNVMLSSNSKEVTDRFSALSKKLFNLESNFREGSKERASNVTVSSVILGKFLDEVFNLPKGSINKTVPNMVIESTKENQQAFIKGLSLDSSVQKKNYPSIYFSSISKDMMSKLSAMLNNMGIYNRRAKRKVYSSEFNRSETFEVIISNADANTYLNEIGFVQYAKENILMDKINSTVELSNRFVGTVLERDINIAYVKVKSVEPVHGLPFYDLNVENEHSFIGNGIINHNTSRLSSSSPNIQNLPSNTSNTRRVDYLYPFKRSFVSRFSDGVIVQADYSSLESRVLGLVAQDDVITQGFLDGKDTHKETASIMNGIPYEDVNKTQRQQAKAITFGKQICRLEQ